MRGLRCLAALLLAPIIWPAAAGSQSIVTGGLEGTVEDRSGRPLQGALVTLRAPGGTDARVETASSGGRFTFELLLPGRYELQAEALVKPFHGARV